jgi:hypothetical protein
MKKLLLGLSFIGTLVGCSISTETAVHSYNGKTVEIELYGDTFAYGTEEQKQAQLNAAQAKATEVCGRNATFLSRRMDHQPQNGIYYVSARNIAIFQCR